MVTTYKTSLVKIDERNFEVTDPQTHKHKNTQKHTNPQTGPITIHCAAKLSAQCNDAQSSGGRLVGSLTFPVIAGLIFIFILISFCRKKVIF